MAGRRTRLRRYPKVVLDNDVTDFAYEEELTGVLEDHDPAVLNGDGDTGRNPDPISDGNAPQTAPVLTVRGINRALALSWTAVPNANGVVYQAHISTAGAGFTLDDDTTMVDQTGGLSLEITHLPDGTPLDTTTIYYLAVRTSDADGKGPTSNVVASRTAKLGNSEIDPGVITADRLLIGLGLPNLVPNSSAEIDFTVGAGGTNDWAQGSSTTILRSQEAVPQHRDWLIKLTRNATTGTASATAPKVTSGITVGVTYTATAQFKAAGTVRSARVTLEFLNGSDSVLQTTSGSSVAEVAGTWIRPSVSAVAPANASRARVVVEVLSALATEIHYVDAVKLERGNTVTTYHAKEDEGLITSVLALATMFVAGTPGGKRAQLSADGLFFLDAASEIFALDTTTTPPEARLRAIRIKAAGAAYIESLAVPSDGLTPSGDPEILIDGRGLRAIPDDGVSTKPTLDFNLSDGKLRFYDDTGAYIQIDPSTLDIQFLTSTNSKRGEIQFAGDTEGSAGQQLNILGGDGTNYSRIAVRKDRIAFRVNTTDTSGNSGGRLAEIRDHGSADVRLNGVHKAPDFIKAGIDSSAGTITPGSTADVTITHDLGTASAFGTPSTVDVVVSITSNSSGSTTFRLKNIGSVNRAPDLHYQIVRRN